MKNVTLQVRIPKNVAVSILGRLYAGRYISREQYETKIAQIDERALEIERQKTDKLERLLSRIEERWEKPPTK